MASGEEVTQEVCMKCAVDGVNSCGYDYGLLRFIFRDRQERPDIHVTDLTGCLRKAYFGKKIPPVQYPHEVLVLSLGSITHGLLETGEDDTDKTELPLDALGIKGTADRVHFLPGGARIIDYKTTRWLKPSNLPYGSHELQVNIYAALLREQGFNVQSAAIQYIDLSGPTKCRACKLTLAPRDMGLVCPSCGNTPANAHLGAVLYEVTLRPHEEIVDLITERRDTLALALEMEDVPDAETGWLCKYCAYADGHCPEGARQVGRG